MYMDVYVPYMDQLTKKENHQNSQMVFLVLKTIFMEVFLLFFVISKFNKELSSIISFMLQYTSKADNAHM